MMEYWDKEAKEGQGDNRRLKGNDIGPYVIPCGPNGPVEPAREKMCIDTITQVNLSNNVYTVSGDPATGVDGLRNNGPGNITVTIADSVKTMTKILKPGDVYSQSFTGFTTITFSANAEFEADILR